MDLHLIEAADRLLEQLEGLREALGRQVLVQEELVGAEDRVRELPEREARDARPDVEALPGREGEEAPVEVEVLAVEVAGEVLVGRDRVVDVAAGATDGGRQLVAEREADTEPGTDALAVTSRGVGVVQVRLVVESLVAEADVAEDRRAAGPVGQARGLLGRLGRGGLRRFGRLGRLLDLLGSRLADRPLLLHLVLQRVELLLGAAQGLFEPADALLRRLGIRATGQSCRREPDQEHAAGGPRSSFPRSPGRSCRRRLGSTLFGVGVPDGHAFSSSIARLRRVRVSRSGRCACGRPPSTGRPRQVTTGCPNPSQAPRHPCLGLFAGMHEFPLE